MADLKSLEADLRGLFYEESPRFIADVDERPQEIYRRLVRNNVFNVVRRALPVLRSVVGEDEVERHIARWLATNPPSTRLLRQVPSEFATWIVEQRDLPHPAFAELAHWEILELDVVHAPNDDDSVRHPPAPALEGYLQPASHARLAAYTHPVHHMKKKSPWPRSLDVPAMVLAYRAAERLAWVELPVVVHQTIVHVMQGHTIGAALTGLGEVHGRAIEPAFVLSWLGDLARRGALLGFPTHIADD